LTANGEVFDPTALAAAHKSLKFGTIVRVVNETNGRSVEVRIFDRGPFVEGRIIDLTPAAAEAIGLIGPGIAMVTLNLQYVPEQPDSRYDRPGDTGWYLLQVGTFADSSRAMKVYRTLVDAGFKVKVEPVLQRLVRLSVRWVPEEDLAATLARLADWVLTVSSSEAKSIPINEISQTPSRTARPKPQGTHSPSLPGRRYR
jgi:rare lipoprotein A